VEQKTKATLQAEKEGESGTSSNKKEPRKKEPTKNTSPKMKFRCEKPQNDASQEGTRG